MPPSGDAPCSDIASHAVPARGYDDEVPDGCGGMVGCLEAAAGGFGGAGIDTWDTAGLAGEGGGGMGVVGVGACAGGAGLPKIARQMPLPKPPPAAGVAGAAGCCCCCLAAAAGAEAGRALDAAAEEEEDGEGVLDGPSSIEADAVEPPGFMMLPNMDNTLVAWSRQVAQWEGSWVCDIQQQATANV